jgi:hypothetical protein
MQKEYDYKTYLQLDLLTIIMDRNLCNVLMCSKVPISDFDIDADVEDDVKL